MRKDLNTKKKKRESLIIILLLLYATFHFFYYADYRGKGWLPVHTWPERKIGETKFEHYWNSSLYALAFPFKTIRANALIIHHRIYYDLIKKVDPPNPLRFGAYVLKLDANSSAVSMITDAFEQEYFIDLNGDGYKQRITWINEKGAMLFVDENNNNKPDNMSELLSVTDVNLWGPLFVLDENKDFIINQRDPAFKKLKLYWGTDKNKDSSNKAFLLSRFVSQIDLKAITKEKEKAIKIVAWKGERFSLDRLWVLPYYTRIKMAKGMHKDLYLMFFDEGTFSAKSRPSLKSRPEPLQYGNYPNFRGYGFVTDLKVAMNKDPKLAGLVQVFVDRDPDNIIQNLNKIDEEVTNILLRWAKVDSIPINSRGLFIDARKLGFIEMITTHRFLQLGTYFDPMPYAADSLKNAWQRAVKHHRASLLMQSGFGKKLGIARYDYRAEFAYTYGLNDEYLNHIAALAQDMSKDEKRKLIQIITDIFDAAVDVDIEDKKLALLTDLEKNFRNEQLDKLASFQKKLFPKSKNVALKGR